MYRVQSKCCKWVYSRVFDKSKQDSIIAQFETIEQARELLNKERDADIKRSKDGIAPLYRIVKVNGRKIEEVDVVK